jgi:adhesin transport system membrane fusion protein
MRTPSSAAPAPRSGWGELPLEDAGARWLPHALLGAILAFFLFALGWAALAELDEVARGEGRVITHSQIQLVQNLEGGILAEILVREGDVVEKGQVLMRIDPTRFVSAFREGEQGVLALKAKIARLAAEADGARFAMPGEVEKAHPVLAAQERSLYETRRRDLATRSAILQQQLAQRENELKELQTREARLRESVALIQKEIAITAPLVKQGVVSEIELLRQEREAARIRTELDAATLAAPRVRSAIAEAKKRIEDGVMSFRSQAGVELSQARAELARLAENMPALEDRVTRATVRSPARGIVKTIPNKTVGGVVQPGSPMAEVVPLEDRLLVETRIRPGDIAFVKAGQRALVKITAYDYSIYGGLEGRIEYVSADSIVPQQGEPFYIAHVRTDSNAIAYGGRLLGVIPGMTASVDVLTGKRTVLYYLLKPVNRARQQALRER